MTFAPVAKRLEDVLRWMAEGNWQTAYEKKHGIVGISQEWVFNGDNCKVLIVHKSDGTDSLFLFLRVGLDSDFWFYSPLFDDMVDMMLNEFPKYWKNMKAKEKKKKILTLAELL